MRPRPLAGLVTGILLVAGCGIDPQAAPEDLDIDPVPAPTTSPADASVGPAAVLWFLRDGQLSPVEREDPAAGPAAALRLLAEGPTAAEADEGITTAFSGQPLTVSDDASATDDVSPADGNVLAVEVTPAFTGVAGADQLSAVAQVVWTATEFGDVDAVLFTTAEGPLEVPTDAGLSDEPVDREDYASLAPDGEVAID